MTVNTEQIDTTPIMDAIKKIWKISEIQIPEQKEIDLSEITTSINSITEELDNIKEDIFKKIEWKKNIYEAVWELFENAINRNDKEDEEEENMNREIPESFTATLS